MSIEEYADLAGTGFQGGGSGEKTPPEEEFYHSAYIAGANRKNHIDIVEQSGKLQIRGVQYNLDEVNMIIVHVKDILANIKKEKGKNDETVCFSFKEGEYPWYGTSIDAAGNKRQCPQTSAERAVNDFCNPCKAQIIVAGIYCKPDGTPILSENQKPIFIFIRGKGMRYSNVSEYLNDLYNEDSLDPLFTPVTDQSKQFEKSVVNNKRFVTNITIGSETSSYGNEVKVFNLTRGTQIPNDHVLQILKLSKQTILKFNEKFDWSKRSKNTGYNQQPVPGVLSVDSGNDKKSENSSDENTTNEDGGGSTTFNFSDISF